MRRGVWVFVVGVGLLGCKGSESESESKALQSGQSESKVGETQQSERGEQGENSEAGENKGLAGMAREMVEGARGEERAPVRLVPGAAKGIARFDVPALLGHPEMKTLWDEVEKKQADVKLAMDVVRACLGRLEAVDEVVIGFDGEPNMVVAVHGTGMGRSETWQCFDRETKARGDEMDLALTGVARGEGAQIREVAGESEARFGYFVDDDTMVLASAGWDEALGGVMRGEDTPAIDGELKAVGERVKQDGSMWVVGVIDGSVRAGLGGALSTAEDVAFGLDVDDGALVVHLSVDAGEREDAKRMQAELQEQKAAFVPMLSMFGVPTSVGPKVEFLSEGDQVSLDLTLTREELEGLRKGISGMM